MVNPTRISSSSKRAPMGAWFAEPVTIEPAHAELLLALLQGDQSALEAVLQQVALESGFRKQVMGVDQYGRLPDPRKPPMGSKQSVLAELREFAGLALEAAVSLEANSPGLPALTSEPGPEAILLAIRSQRLRAWGAAVGLPAVTRFGVAADAIDRGLMASAELWTALLGFEPPLASAAAQCRAIAEAVRAHVRYREQELVAKREAASADNRSRRAHQVYRRAAPKVMAAVQPRANAVPLDYLERVMAAADPLGSRFSPPSRSVDPSKLDEVPAVERLLALIRFYTWGMRRLNDCIGSGPLHREEAWARAWFEHRAVLRVTRAKKVAP